MQVSPTEDVSTILVMAGLQFINAKSTHDGLDGKVLACTHGNCLYALSTGPTLLTHIKNHDIPLTKQQQNQMINWLTANPPLTRSEDVSIPLPGMPPIHGLKVHDGLACLLCTYCTMTATSMESHISCDHPGAYP
jgi:Orsellinic acid/F9775 biosynthesis cluster protein D